MEGCWKPQEEDKDELALAQLLGVMLPIPGNGMGIKFLREPWSLSFPLK
jgi:hypothetical protein